MTDNSCLWWEEPYCRYLMCIPWKYKVKKQSSYKRLSLKFAAKCPCNGDAGDEKCFEEVK